jgi:hypothetical protein
MTLSGSQNVIIKTAGLWPVTMATLTKYKYSDRKAENKRKDKLRDWK